jgi:hypothetical protein
MVKLGFICEGETEKIIIESFTFSEFLLANNFELVKAFDATGNGNLLPENISPMINNLREEGAEKIFVITDLDEDVCITKTKERINAPEGIIVIVSVKKIEAWFLADSSTLSSIFKGNFLFENPENESDPRKVLKDLFIEKTVRGIGESKPRFATKMINNGFSVINSATHPNCSSAKYFIQRLLSSL